MCGARRVETDRCWLRGLMCDSGFGLVWAWSGVSTQLGVNGCRMSEMMITGKDYLDYVLAKKHTNLCNVAAARMANLTQNDLQRAFTNTV